MLTAAVTATLARDLRALRREIEAYPAEAALWQEVPGVRNPAGTLALHLTGNLQHYIGTRLGRTGYVRDRDAEFSRRNVPASELLQQITAAERVLPVLDRLTEPDLEADFPEIVGGSRIATGEFLVHLVAHFAYHLGQIDYHRRAVTGLPGDLAAVRPSELRTARPPSPV